MRLGQREAVGADPVGRAVWVGIGARRLPGRGRGSDAAAPSAPDGEERDRCGAADHGLILPELRSVENPPLVGFVRRLPSIATPAADGGDVGGRTRGAVSTIPVCLTFRLAAPYPLAYADPHWYQSGGRASPSAVLLFAADPVVVAVKAVWIAVWIGCEDGESLV
jgi:hypothetical protein